MRNFWPRQRFGCIYTEYAHLNTENFCQQHRGIREQATAYTKNSQKSAQYSIDCMRRPHTADFPEFSVATPRYPKISWATMVTKKFSKFSSIFSLPYTQTTYSWISRIFSSTAEACHEQQNWPKFSKVTNIPQKSAWYSVYCIHSLYSWLSRNFSDTAEACHEQQKWRIILTSQLGIEFTVYTDCMADFRKIPAALQRLPKISWATQMSNISQKSARYPICCWAGATHCNTLQQTATHCNTRP